MDFERVHTNILSKIFGISARTVARWNHSGMPRNEDGTYSAPEAIQWCIDRAKLTEPEYEEPDDAKTWLTEFRKERALKARLERETLEGKLFPREDVTAAWCNRYAHIRRHLLTWSKRLPGRLTGIGEREAIELLEEEVCFLLSLLARPGEFTPDLDPDSDVAV